MSTKAKIILGYAVTVLLAAIYLANWGPNSYRSFAYNLGTAFVWPVMVFPGVGQFLGAIVLVVLVGLVVFS